MARVTCEKCMGQVNESMAYECWKDGEVEYICDLCWEEDDVDYYDEALMGSEITEP